MRVTRRLYENLRVLDKDGNLMFRCNRDKAEWYLSRGLARKLSETDFQLTFEPRGRGMASCAYCLEDRRNVCVVCGADRDLSRHHVVPRCYRRHLPRDVKRDHYDVLLLCVGCHVEYEKRANPLRKSLALRHDAPLGDDGGQRAGELRQHKLAWALDRYWDKIPPGRRAEMLSELGGLAGGDVGRGDLPGLWRRNSRRRREKREHGRLVVAGIEDVQAFIEQWRAHFLATMKPRFLSDKWTVERTRKP